jgi:hypothetical protein
MLLVSMAAGPLMAQDEAREDMPPMGPPPEIQAAAFLVGTWDVASQMRMDPDSAFTAFSGVAEYSYIAGGAAIQMVFSTEMMGTPFHGVGQTAFNRDTGEWTESWIDNMGGYMSVYRGKMVDGKKVLVGQDHMMGQIWETRITTSDMTPTSFKWQLEHSRDGGKTWGVYMTSTYSKRPK